MYCKQCRLLARYVEENSSDTYCSTTCQYVNYGISGGKVDVIGRAVGNSILICSLSGDELFKIALKYNEFKRLRWKLKKPKDFRIPIPVWNDSGDVRIELTNLRHIQDENSRRIMYGPLCIAEEK